MADQRPIRAASAAVARRRGQHALAPPHLSDATAAATVALIVGGVALVITGLGMVATGLTMGARYAANPPPDVASLGLVPIALGAAILVLGGALTAAGVAVLGDARGSRPVAGGLAALAAALSALGTVLVMATPPPDTVLAIALLLGTLVFGVAAILLLRPRR